MLTSAAIFTAASLLFTNSVKQAKLTKKSSSSSPASISTQEEYPITSLFIYPVKSLKGIEVSKWPVDQRGFLHDRRWLIVRAEDKQFITQRQMPSLALLETSVTLDGHLTISATKDNKKRSFSIQSLCYKQSREQVLATKLPIYQVAIFDASFNALDCGDAAAEFLSGIIGKNVRLVETLPTDEGEGKDAQQLHTRTAAPRYAIPLLKKRPELGKVCSLDISFADGFSFLITSEESLDQVNQKIFNNSAVDLSNNTKHFDMRRFRPNIVIKVAKPFEEDSFFAMSINRRSSPSNNATILRMYNFAPCTRCSIITVDPDTGVADMKITPAMSKIRGGADQDGKPLFGIKVCHENKAIGENLVEVQVGDYLAVQEHQSAPKLI